MILRQELFGEYDISQMEMTAEAATIIPRVLERGTFDDWNEIRNFYGYEVVKKILLQVRYLSNKALHFAASFYNLSPEKFRLYTQKQLNHIHWTY
jgi:hypothetical protein